MSASQAPLSPATQELGGAEAAQLKQHLQRGDLSGLRRLLAHTNEQRDWQDRYFMLDLLAPFILSPSLETALASEPNAADLMLLRGVLYFDLLSKARGVKTADKVTEQQVQSAAQHIKTTVADLRRAMQLNPQDPTPYVFTMRSLQVFSEHQQYAQETYQKAVQLVPDFLPAHWARINSRSEKWGGSHAESLQLARSVAAAAKPGSDTPACLFYAHLLVWQFAKAFDKNEKRAATYLKDRAIQQELTTAFDRWMQPPYQPRRSSVLYLQHAAHWFYRVEDRERLARALTHCNGAFFSSAWSFGGGARQAYAEAVALAAKKKGILGWLKS